MSGLVSPVFGLVEARPPSRFGGGVVAAAPVLVAAPASVVWDVIADFAAYPEWNPLNRTFACAGGVGASVTLGVSWGPYDGRLRDPTLTIREVVTIWEPGRCLAFCDDRGWAHRAERTQLLTETSDGTVYQTWERWAGWFTPVIAAIYASRIRVGFAAASGAVKARAEAR